MQNTDMDGPRLGIAFRRPFKKRKDHSWCSPFKGWLLFSTWMPSCLLPRRRFRRRCRILCWSFQTRQKPPLMKKKIPWCFMGLVCLQKIFLQNSRPPLNLQYWNIYRMKISRPATLRLLATQDTLPSRSISVSWWSNEGRGAFESLAEATKCRTQLRTTTPQSVRPPFSMHNSKVESDLFRNACHAFFPGWHEFVSNCHTASISKLISE